MAKIPSYSLGILVSLFLAVEAHATDLPVRNWDFSQPMEGRMVPGWRLEQHAGEPAYEMMLVPDTENPGNSAFRIRRTKEEVYGLIAQEIPLNAPLGQDVEISARMKTDGVGPGGWVLVLDMIGRSHRILPPTSLKQVRSAPLSGNSEWSVVKVRATIPANTTTIEISAMLLDAGTGWVDDVRATLQTP